MSQIQLSLTTTPASGTPEAANILKVFVGAAVYQATLQTERVEPSKKNGPQLSVTLTSAQPPAVLFEANAVLRYLASQSPQANSAGLVGALAALRLNSLFEIEEKRIVPLLAAKRPDLAQIYAALDPLAQQFIASAAAVPGPAEVALFSDLYFVYSASSAEATAPFPHLQAWFTALNQRPGIAVAITAAQAFLDVVPVVIFQKPSLSNRRVGPVRELSEDLSGKVRPIPGQRNVLITSALPYVNNVPHLGNIIGSTLSADVYARYARLRGFNTLFVCGTDEYGTATETKALEEGVSCQELCDKYNAIHRQVYDWFDLSFDHFGRTTTQKQTEVAQDMFHSLHRNGFTIEDTLTQLFCETCQRFLADRYVEGVCPKCKYEDARGDQCDACGTLLNAADLEQPRCKLDGNRPILRESTHIFLDLPQLQPKVEAFVERSIEAGQWSVNGRTITHNWLREGLKPRCITRDLKWGTPVPLEHMKDKVFYVWYDAPIGYPSITANYTDDWQAWWKNPKEVQLYQFMGKDNVPFHSVIFPACEIGTGEDWTLVHHISTTEYLNYEGGKFSKSRNIGVFGTNVMDTGIPVEVWRYYLLANRPETSDSIFTWKEFVMRNNTELLANVGNFCNRVMKFINTAKYQCVVPAWSEALVHPPTGAPATAESRLIGEVNQLLTEYIANFDAVRIRTALKLAMEISQRGNGYLQESKLDNSLYTNHRAQCDTVIAVGVNLIYLLSALFYPFMPSTARAMCQQLNAPLHVIPTEFNLDLLPGHVVGEAEHLFKRIDEKMADVYRERYGGGSSKAK
ncbi:methionine--tRNA ligase mes1 [Dimargaris cristalligena]|uniref:methionine--tRNA ligase n=1 Tax=Dimargaris cristalligena TaxID=215637 RepID=A0A4P9ZMT4_9FUNG|nr:methionine--tRNA ligase mes1 [Dimargaris cristalligena]RKP34704.1 tRNA synthetases class I (M)-domain-containing protein [Dimargaris cristalligena]|eukprot:RKP34704.1 tRNA synthetases class I (M)-domain-containing protein [Dimargaris cristalligena]